jgi:hypothetical protein
MIFRNLYYVDDDFRRHGQKKDILSSCLVCSRLAGIGQAVAFEHIAFLQDEKGIQRLFELSKSPLCRAVKSMSCYFEVFDTQRTSTVEAFRTWLRLDWLCPLKVQEMFEEYCRKSRYQDLLERTGLDVTVALHRFQSLRAVEMGSWADRWYYAMDDDEFNRLFASSTGHRFFEAIANSLAKAGNRIENLTVGYFHNDEPSYSDDTSALSIIQRLSPACPIYHQAFQRLKRLRIALPGSGADGTVHRLNFHGLSALIRSAVLLEELWLSFSVTEDTSPVPSRFLRSLDIPHLRVLVLNGAMITTAALVMFLGKHATTLKAVQLHSIDLRYGSWEALCSRMRDTLTLESCCINGFGMYDPEIRHELAGQFLRNIEEFVQRKGDLNPFDSLRQATASLNTLPCTS